MQECDSRIAKLSNVSLSRRDFASFVFCRRQRELSWLRSIPPLPPPPHSLSIYLLLSRLAMDRHACTHAEVRRPWDGRVISWYAKRAGVLGFAHATHVRTCHTDFWNQSLVRHSISDSLYWVMGYIIELVVTSSTSSAENVARWCVPILRQIATNNERRNNVTLASQRVCTR